MPQFLYFLGDLIAVDPLFQQLKNNLSQINGLHFLNSQQILMFIGITNINPIRIIDTEKIWKLLINAECTDDLRDYWPLAYYGIWSD